MPLLADYQARYSSEVRINASNPQLSTATVVDGTRETNAAADAQADFEAICGVAYSSSNTIHVSAAVPLVYYKLLVYTGQASGEWYDKQLERLSKWYRLVLGRNRITPTTDSELSPSAEKAGAKPWGDLSQFGKLIGNAPSGNTVTDGGETEGRSTRD